MSFALNRLTTKSAHKSSWLRLALCPSESIISYRTKSASAPLLAAAAVLKADGSAIVSRGAARPAELAGKVYASYKARFEDAIVQYMVDFDTKASDNTSKTSTQIQVAYPSKIGIWNTVLDGNADATWIFDCWEGVQARRQGHKLNYFRLEDYGIPYGYSPVLAVNEAFALEREKVITAALSAIARGYEQAARDPEAAAKCVYQAMVDSQTVGDLDLDFVIESQDAINPLLNIGNRFGAMEADVWDRFVQFLKPWLTDKSGDAVQVNTSELWSNRYLSI